GTVNGNMKEWTDKLDDALWAFRTAYKSPIGWKYSVQDCIWKSMPPSD
ncbi:hypothetical protein Tco_0388150, partial [Tanacetum coccineum]